MYSSSEIQRGKYINVDAIKTTIDEGPYDAVIVMSPENVPYYSGFYNFDLRGIPERIHFVIWPKGGEPTWVVTTKRAQFLVPGETFLSNIQTYEGEEAPDSINVVSRVLKDMGVERGKIGYEGRNFPAGHMAVLREQLPDAQFEDAFKFLVGQLGEG